MTRPLIAVAGHLTERAQGMRTGGVAAGRRYLEALRRAGGQEAVLMPATDRLDELPELLGRFDGVLLLGGGDVDPAAYGAPRRAELIGVEPVHDAFEVALVRAAIERGMPMLAVCRGMQVLNVALGGTLHQHITDDETTVHHRGRVHGVALTPGSRTARAMGTLRPSCASFHHQAVDRLADGLEVTAVAADGLVEGVEYHRGWVVGVQWHPEDTAGWDRCQQGLFDTLVAEAGAGR